MKQAKRISKIKKNPKNALVVGSAFGHLEEYIGLFSTIFVLYNSEERIRHKTLIYRDTVESLNYLTEIDFIFVDREYFDEIKNFYTVWRKSSPVILTQGNTFKDSTTQFFLNSEHYWAVDITKQYMIWKQK
jgi:hypothetical protein